MSQNAPASIDNVLSEAKTVDGVNLYHSERVERTSDGVATALRQHDALLGVAGMHYHATKPVHQRLKIWAEIAMAYRKHIGAQQEVINGLRREVQQIKAGQNARARKRWTDAEDALLIERAADGEDVQQIALHFGRTPGAVTARISYLVGVKRITQAFAGSIRGYLNGEEVEGTFVGDLRR